MGTRYISRKTVGGLHFAKESIKQIQQATQPPASLTKRKTTVPFHTMTEPFSQRGSSPPAFDKMTDFHDQTLQKFHTGQLATEAAASKLARVTIPDPTIDPDECEESLQLLWSNVLASLIQAPDRVGSVANLILCISRLPPVVTESGKELVVNEGLQRVWDDAPTLTWALREEWDGRFAAVLCYQSDFLISNSHQ